jgi:hypothetical protein
LVGKGSAAVSSLPASMTGDCAAGIADDPHAKRTIAKLTTPARTSGG